MEILTFSTQYQESETFTVEEIYTSLLNNTGNGNTKAQSILIIQSVIASVGIIANLTVIAVFLNHKKLRRKIPNIFIINQVSFSWIFSLNSMKFNSSMVTRNTPCLV